MLKRIYHPYWKWEEVNHNMWGQVKDKKEYLKKAIGFTGNHFAYGQYMRRVTNEWFFSCENALTDKNLNRKAWIGRAACALAFDCPENITREAWGYLTNEQRILANKEAERAIESWENNRRNGRSLCNSMGKQMLFKWDSR